MTYKDLVSSLIHLFPKEKLKLMLHSCIDELLDWMY